MSSGMEAHSPSKASCHCRHNTHKTTIPEPTDLGIYSIVNLPAHFSDSSTTQLCTSNDSSLSICDSGVSIQSLDVDINDDNIETMKRHSTGITMPKLVDVLPTPRHTNRPPPVIRALHRLRTQCAQHKISAIERCSESCLLRSNDKSLQTGRM